MEQFNDYFDQINIYIFAIIIAVITVILASFFNRTFGRYIKYSTENLQNDPTNYQFLKHSITALIYLVGFGWALFTLPAFKAVANSLLTGAGILAVVAGIASQHALSNIMSGLFIVIFKPFRVKDRLLLKEKLEGIVEDITLRHTVIRDFEGRRIIVPNTVISNEIIINSDFKNEEICRRIDVKIGFDCDLDKAKRILQEEVEKHPLHIDVRTPEQKKNNTPSAQVRVIKLTDNGMMLRAWAWAEDAGKGFLLYCDLLESVKKRFDKEGIEIPYPHYTITQKEERK